VTKLFDPPIDSSDSYLRDLLDHPEFEKNRQYLESLWEEFEPYADKNYMSEFCRDFHPRFWEMYLGCSFLEHNYRLMHRFSDAGPDIKLDLDGLTVWIEAVAPKKGKGADAVPGLNNDESEKVQWFRVPEEKIILRFTSEIKDKNKKYLDYLAKEIVKFNEPFVIAINGYEVWPYSEDPDIPLICKAAFPIGQPTIPWDDDDSFGEEEYSFRPVINKSNNSPVFTNDFLTGNLDGISGILFSLSNYLILPQIAGEDMIFIQNPTAKNPLPNNWINFGLEYWLEPGKLYRKVLPW